MWRTHLVFALALASCVCLAGTAAEAATHPGVLSFGRNFHGRTGLNTSDGATFVPTPIDATHLAGNSVKQVAAGLEHSLFLTDDGTVFSVGNASGEGAALGRNPADSSSLVAAPIDVTNLAGRSVTQVAAGARYSLLLTEDGTVYSFGENLFGRTGQNTTWGETLIATPIHTTNLAGKRIKQVAAGYSSSLALAEDGTVFSFGWNFYGQLGRPGDWEVAAPIDTTNLAGQSIKQVATGGYHNLLLTEDGTVFSFGSNIDGVTGLNTSTGNTLIATPIHSSSLGGKTIIQIAAGHSHSLLLADDGTVFAFGSNAHGRTGLNTTVGSTRVATPINTSHLAGTRITQVAAGYTHSLLLADDGTVFSFGSNFHGETARAPGASPSVATPINRSSLIGPYARVIAITAGEQYSLLLAVPEPSTGTLLLVAAMPLLLRRRFSCRL